MVEKMDYSTYEGQKYLVNQIKAGDAAASELLYKQVYKIIASYASSAYKSSGCHFGISYNDIFQNGVLGYLESIKLYDDSYNVKFTTFSTFYIKKYCYLTETEIGYRQRNNIYLYNRFKEQGYSDEQIKDKLGIKNNSFNNLMNLNTVLSLDAQFENEQGDSFSSIVPDDYSLEKEVNLAENYRVLQKFIDTELSELEKDCLFCVNGEFGYEKKSINSVLSKYNITRIKFNNIRAKTKRKIRTFLAKNHFSYSDFVS